MEKEFIHFEEQDIPINIHKITMHQDGNYRGMHSHAEVEIVEVKYGNLCCHINDETIYPNPGEIIFINSNTGHSLASDSAEIIYAQVDVRFFGETISNEEFSNLYEFISDTRAKPYLVFTGNREIRDILQKIYAKYFGDRISNRWYLKAYIYELVAFMHSESFIFPPTVSADSFKKIEAIVRYIDMNFRSPITLDEISQAVKYSKYAICHYFKSVTGATVFDYINFLRVHFAIKELEQKSSSILEIASSSGFSSPTYFNRVFKSIIGCSPSVYRKYSTEKPAKQRK